MISVAVVGGTGYTGVELIRLLVMHPEVELKLVTSRAEAGTRVADLFPNLRGYTDIAYSQPDLKALHDCDLVFFATPNGTAMGKTPELINNGTRVIDLAADFRLNNPILFQQWYGMAHQCEDLLSKAVYGLPELNREAIRDALIVANPGCYPTAVTLGFLPLLEQNIIDDQHLIADAKSGVSGAGRGAKTAHLHGEVAENFRAYAVEGHRHLPEIRQTLGETAGHSIGLTFVPHLVPMVRGIEATLYAKMKKTDIDLYELFSRRYADEPFVDVLPAGVYPETRSVRGANMCLLSVVRPQQDDTVVVSAVIDNLVKGAAGQAVQNMNIMFGFDETSGLRQPGLLP